MPRLQEVECMEVSDCQSQHANSLERMFQNGNLLIVEPVMDSDLQNLLDDNETEKRIHRMTAPEVLSLDLNEKQRWNSQFDAVVCDSLDDVIDVKDLLKSISEMLKSEGILLLKVQNTKHRFVVDELLDGSWRQNVNRLKARRYYTKREIEKLLFRSGFDVTEIQSDENEEFKNWKAIGNSTFFRTGRLQADRVKNDEIEEFYTKAFTVIATKSVKKNQSLTSIIILTHNQVDYTRMCIDSIRRFTDEPFELIVVDNASDDATIAYLKSLDNVKLIFNQTNRGFPAAVNQGIELATGEYLLLLNNDTIVTTGWLKGMQETMQRESKIGLVGPCSNNVSGPQQIDCQLADLACLDGFAWERRKEFSNRIRESERLVGFCLLIKRKVIDKIGNLDERFGTGCFEDDDFCRRAIEAGFQNVIADDAFVYHFGSITFRNSNVDFGKLMQENREKFEQKWNDDPKTESSNSNSRWLGTTAESPQTAQAFENDPLDSSNPMSQHNWKVKTSETGGLLLEKKTCRLSLCMIVRDNENTIEPCLKSIQRWVDEIIVVDTGSLDRTPQLCEKYGAKLFHFLWCDDFSRARNESLNYASGEWIFWMDSDDTIPEECGRKLKELAAGNHDPNIMGYVMQVHCPGKDSENDKDLTAVDHVKMFRNRDELRFEHRIHEQIIPAIRRIGGDVAFTDIYVVHSGSDRTPEGRMRKLKRDYNLLELDLKERPDHPFVLFNMGMTLADDDRHDEAIRYLQRCISISQPNESHLRKAYALLIGSFSQSNRHHEAWQSCVEGLNYYPDDKELLFRAAMLHQHFGRFQDAERAYLRVIAENEDRHFSSIDADLAGYKSRHNLALVYEDMGKTVLAEQQWRLAIDEHPQSRGDWRGLGECLLKQNKTKEVHELIRDLETKHNLAPIGAILLARMKEDAEEIDSAIASLEKASSLFSNDVDIQNEICRILFYRGSSENAEIALQTLLELDPKDAAGWHNLGVIYARAGKNQLAKEAFETSLSYRPNSEQTIQQLADLESENR